MNRGWIDGRIFLSCLFCMIDLGQLAPQLLVYWLILKLKWEAELMESLSTFVWIIYFLYTHKISKQMFPCWTLKEMKLQNSTFQHSGLRVALRPAEPRRPLVQVAGMTVETDWTWCLPHFPRPHQWKRFCSCRNTWTPTWLFNPFSSFSVDHSDNVDPRPTPVSLFWQPLRQIRK